VLRVRTCAKSRENGRVRDGDGLDCAEERYPCGQPYGRLSSVQKVGDGPKRFPDKLAWWLLLLLFPLPYSPWWLGLIFFAMFCFLVWGFTLSDRMQG